MHFVLSDTARGGLQPPHGFATGYPVPCIRDCALGLGNTDKYFVVQNSEKLTGTILHLLVS